MEAKADLDQMRRHCPAASPDTGTIKHMEREQPPDFSRAATNLAVTAWDSHGRRIDDTTKPLTPGFFFCLFQLLLPAVLRSGGR
jgi:hypothetical protein